MVRPWPVLDRFLADLHWLASKVFGPVVLGTLLLGLAAFAAGTASGVRPREVVLNRRVWLFSAGLFLVCLYASCQIEFGYGRYTLPYLPLLALTASTTVAALIELIRKWKQLR